MTPAELAGPRHWDLSCRDWASRLRKGLPLIHDLPLIEDEAALAVAFFDALRLPDVPGRPFLGEAAGEWFKDIVRALFGSWDPALGLRFIEEIFCLVPKKNSKTTYGAGLMMVALLMNKRPRAEYLLVGPTQSISDLAYAQASGMVEADEQLSKRFWVRENLKTIQDRMNGTKLKIKTFDVDILTGPRPAGVLLDEVHLLGRHAQASKVLRQLRGGRQATPEGFLIMLTTQSDEAPSGAFKSELNTARAIRDGKVQGKLLPVLYEFPEDIARDKTQRWRRTPELWKMVLPNLGRPFTLQQLVDDFALEQTKGDKEVQLWASQHLNIEIGVSIVDDAWAGALVWESRGEPDLTLDQLLTECDVVTAGIDGGGLDDMLGLCFIGRHRVTKHWLHWAHAWVDKIVLQRRQEIAPKLLDLHQRGDLTIVDALGEDIDQLVDYLARVDALGLLAMVGLDPAGVGAIVDALAEVGIGGPEDETKDAKGTKLQRVVGISQGWRLHGAVASVERKLRDGTMQHGAQPMMEWCVGNAKVVLRGSARVVDKSVSGTGKIDPLMATFDAAALMATNPQAPKRTKHDVNDFLKNAVVA